MAITNHNGTNGQPPATMNELCDYAETWLKEYFQSTRTDKTHRSGLRYFRAVVGDIAPSDLKAEHIWDYQQAMVDADLSRRTCNDYLARTRQILKWAACPPRRWISPVQLTDILLIQNLKANRTRARETPGRTPVSVELVEATAAVAPPALAVMIRLHWLTGMRPGEVVKMRKSELTEVEGVMVYSPGSHKTQHHGKHRNIVIGPRGCEILKAWLPHVTGDYLFPIRSSSGYRHAINRVNKRHRLRKWCIVQIRHSFLTLMAEHSLDAARACAGHSKLDMSLHYSKHDLRLAIQTQKQFG